MTSNQLYDVLDSLPKRAGRWRVTFAVLDSGMGAASYQLGVCDSVDESYCCITSDDGGDMYRTVDELKFRLSYSLNSKVLFLDDKYWETPRAADCYEVEECHFEGFPDLEEDGGVHFVQCVLRVKRFEACVKEGEIHWFKDWYGANESVVLKQSQMIFTDSDDAIETTTEAGLLKIGSDMFPKSISSTDAASFKCLPHGSTRPHEGITQGFCL